MFLKCHSTLSLIIIILTRIPAGNGLFFYGFILGHSEWEPFWLIEKLNNKNPVPEVSFFLPGTVTNWLSPKKIKKVERHARGCGWLSSDAGDSHAMVVCQLQVKAASQTFQPQKTTFSIALGGGLQKCVIASGIRCNR